MRNKQAKLGSHARAALFALAMLPSLGALAVQPDEILADPALEARARSLSAELRCLVCQNQSIDDSNAPLARDLRLLVRERLLAKDSDAQVRAYVVDRYGEFVLLKPPFNPGTLILWLTPLFVLAGAIVLAYRAGFGKTQTASADLPLSADEKARLDRALREGDGA